MEDIRGVRLRKFKLRKIILWVRMHFRHTGAVKLENSAPLSGLHECTLWSKNVSPFVTLWFLKRWRLTDFYNILHIVYRVNLQHNTYWYTRLTYVQFCYTPWGSQLYSTCITFSNQSYILPVRCKKKISSLYTQSGCTWASRQVFNWLPF